MRTEGALILYSVYNNESEAVRIRIVLEQGALALNGVRLTFQVVFIAESAI